MKPVRNFMKTVFIATIFFLGSAFFAMGSIPAYAESDYHDLGNITHGNYTQFNWFTRGFGVKDYGNVLQPGVIVQRITAIFFGLMGTIAVVMVMYSGFLWLTAGGEEEKTKQATTLLFQSFVGLLIILASWTLTYFVLAQLTRAVLK